MSPRVTVAHVITQLELGGAQQNTLYTVAHLRRDQFRPLLLAGPGGALDQAARALVDVPFLTVPNLIRPIAPGDDARALRHLTKIFSALPRPLIVHTHSSKAGVLGRLAARQSGADSVVHSVHGFGFFPGQAWAKRQLFQQIERSLASLADAYICVSATDKDTGLALGLFAEAQVELIRSGIVFDEFAFDLDARFRLRKSLGLDDETVVVGTVANLKPQKAPLDFVAMASQVLQQQENLHFVYVGDGPLRPQVEDALGQAGLQDRVHLVGWQDDVAAYLSLFDIFVLSSRHEGLPRAVLQALRSGCRVLATDTGGTSEVLDRNHLVAPGDVTAMATRLRQILTDLDLTAALDRRRQGTIPPVLRGFDADTMVQRQERLYRGLLTAR